MPVDKHDRLAMTQKLNKHSDLLVTRVDRNYGIELGTTLKTGERI